MSVKKEDIDFGKAFDKSAATVKTTAPKTVEKKEGDDFDKAFETSVKKKDIPPSVPPSNDYPAGGSAVPGTTNTINLKWEDNPLNPIKAVNDYEAARDKTPDNLFKDGDSEKLRSLLTKHRVAPSPTTIPGGRLSSPTIKPLMQIEYENASNLEASIKDQIKYFKESRLEKREPKSSAEKELEDELIEVQNLKRKAATELAINGDKEVVVNRRTNEIGNSFNQFMNDIIKLNPPVKGTPVKTLKETEDQLMKMPTQFLTGVNMLKLTEPAEYERVTDAIAKGLPVSASQVAKITALGLNIEEAKLRRDMMKSPVTGAEKAKFEEVSKYLETIKPAIDTYEQMIKNKETLSKPQVADYEEKIKQYNTTVQQFKPLIEKVNAVEGDFAKRANTLLDVRRKNLIDNPEVLRSFIADGVATKLDEIGKMKQGPGLTAQKTASDFMFGHTWNYSPEQIKWASEQYLKEQGINPDMPQVKDAIKFLQENEGVMIGENSIAKAGGFRELGEGLIEPIVGTAKTLKDLSRSSNATYVESQSQGNVDIAKKRLESEDTGVRGVVNDVLKGTGQFATQAALMYATSSAVGTFSEMLLGKEGVKSLAIAKNAKINPNWAFDDATANLAAGKFLDKVKDPLAVFTTSYAMSYDGNLKAALSYTSDNSLAKRAASFNAAMEGVTELFLSPLEIAQGIYSKFARNQTKDLLKILSDKSLKNDPSALKEYVNKFVKGVVGTAKVSGAEMGEEMVTQISDYVTNMYLNPNSESFKNRDLSQELMTTVYQTGLSMAVPALLNGIGSARANTFSKGSLLVAAQNRQMMVDNLNRNLAEGRLSQSEVNQQIQLVNTAADVNANLPKKANGTALNPNEKANYIWSRVTEAYMDKKISSISDKAEEEIWRNKIKEQQEYRKQILGLSEQEPETPLYTIDDKPVDRKEFLETAESKPDEHTYVVTGDEEAQQVIRNIGGIDDKKADIDRRKQALKDIMEATGEWVFINGVSDGTFAGEGLLNMNDNGDVILTRFADSEEGLTKGKGKTENLASIAGQFGGEQIATSGVEGGLASFSNGIIGEYHIPLNELISLIKEGYIVFAGLGNKEFVLSPHIADKYLSKINGKQINAKNNEPVAKATPTDEELVNAIQAKNVPGYSKTSIDELKEQALQAPDSFKNQFGDDEATTINLIAKNTTDQINKAIEYQQERLKDPDIDEKDIEAIDKHIQLLEQGLKQRQEFFPQEGIAEEEGKPLSKLEQLKAKRLLAKEEVPGETIDQKLKHISQQPEEFGKDLVALAEKRFPKVKPTDVKNENLTKEAQDLLASIGEGSKPTFITKNLERIAKENGIEVTDKMSADDVINALKEKQKQQSEQVGSVVDVKDGFKQAGEKARGTKDATHIGRWMLDNSQKGDVVRFGDGGYEVTEVNTRKDGTKEIVLTPFEFNEDGTKDYNNTGIKIITEQSIKNGSNLFENAYTNSKGERVVEQSTYERGEQVGSVGGDVEKQYNEKKKSIEDKLNQQLEDNKDRLDDIEDKGGTKTVRQKIYQEHTNDMVELEKWKMREDLKNEKIKADKKSSEITENPDRENVGFASAKKDYKKANEIKDKIKSLRSADGSISEENLPEYKRLRKEYDALEEENNVDRNNRVATQPAKWAIDSFRDSNHTIGGLEEVDALKKSLKKDGYTDSEIDYIIGDIVGNKSDLGGKSVAKRFDEVNKNKAVEQSLPPQEAKAEQPTVSDNPALRDVESTAKALDAKKADIERRRQELESSREIETLYDLTTPIAEDSKEIVAKIDKANELKKEAAVIREQAAKETNEERKIALNSDADSLYEKAIILDKEIKTSRDSVINNTPIKQAIKSAKSLGQRLLNKIKLAAKSNEWVSSMPISKEEFTKLEDAIKRLSVKNMGEVTSNSEVIPDILLIEEINAKYDAELKALGQQPTTSNQSEIEAKKADIERRRQEEFDNVASQRVIKVEDYESTNDEGETTYIQVRHYANGSRKIFFNIEKNKYGNTNDNSPNSIAKEQSTEDALKYNFDESTFGKPKKVGERTAKEASLDSHDSKINAKYDEELKSLEQQPTSTAQSESNPALRDVESTAKALEDISESDFDKLSPTQKVALYNEHGVTKEDGSPITEKDIENNPLQYSYDFMASSDSGKWNSANSELESAVQGNRKQYSLYKLMNGEFDTFKEFVDFINSKNYGDKIEYTERMKRADDMSPEERKSAVDSYNKSVEDKTSGKAQKEKDILNEHGLTDEKEYSPSELIEKFPLKGVQKVIWDIIKPIAEKLGIKVKFSSSRITEGFDGSSNPMNGEILIRPSTLKNGRLGEVLVHEVVHSLTTKIISRVNSGVETGLTSKQVAAVKGLNKLYKSIKADNNLQNKYPVKDIFEFIAHLTNDSFVKELESKDRNFIKKVVDFISDILGLSNANELAKKYLKDIIHDGTFLEKEGITVVSSDYAANVKGAEGLSPKQRLLEAIKNNSKNVADKYHSDKKSITSKAVESLLSKEQTPPALRDVESTAKALSENIKQELNKTEEERKAIQEPRIKDVNLNKQIGLLSADFLDINQPTSTSSRIKIVDVPLFSISTDTSSFQNRETEYSQESVDKIMKAVEDGRFNWTEFDPITLWKDADDGKLFVLSGHSRFEAFKRLSEAGNSEFETIPAEIFEGSKEDAIAIALRSNTLSTKETPIERANFYREARLKGTSNRSILNEAKEYEGRNAPTIIALSYLNPNGKAISDLKALGQEGDTKSKANSLQMARWVGEVRQQFPQITNEHENEIYDWLKGGAYSKIKNLAEISSRINNVVSGFDFDSEKPLNLEHRATKSYVDEQYEEQLENKEKEIKAQQKIIADKATKYNEANLSPQEVAEKLVPDNAILSRMQQDYIKLKEKKGAISQANRGILSLFDNIQTEIDNGTLTEQQAEDFINNTREIEERDAIIEDIERYAESQDTAATAIEEGNELIRGEDVVANRVTKAENKLADRIAELEKEKRARLNEITKPVLDIPTLVINDLFTLASTTEANRQEYNEIKDQFYSLKNLIDCLYS